MHPQAKIFFRERVVKLASQAKAQPAGFPKDIPYHLGFHSVEVRGDLDFKDLDLRTFLGAGLAFALLEALGFGDPSVEPLPLEKKGRFPCQEQSRLASFPLVEEAAWCGGGGLKHKLHAPELAVLWALEKKLSVFDRCSIPFNPTSSLVVWM